MRYEDEIREIISTVEAVTEPVESIPADMNLQNAGMTSLTFVSLIVEIEEKFGIEFPADKFVISCAGTIEALCEIVDSLTGG